MNKKFTSILITGLFAAGLGLAMQQPIAHADRTINKYTWYTYRSDEDIPTYYTKSKTNAYIWNTNFKKKIHNLKNYYNTTWFVTRSFVHNKRVYYKISNFGGKVSGYTWSGNVAPFLARNINSFSSDSDYTNYLNTDRSQKLARAVLKLFPNADVSLDLSKKAIKNVTNNLYPELEGYSHVINLSSLQGNYTLPSVVTNGKPYSSKQNMRYVLSSSAPSAAYTAQQVSGILQSNGYTSKKIAALISQGYKLGISVSGNLYTSANKQGYPSTLKGGTIEYGLVLAK
ncbi:hypothetical protein PL11_007455 [Lentilactobacillus curieae]|uniref:D-alanyl-D-alanine carboxypeptidase n=1 Tax=Lentilactobacillus curieae TaxID=1138822 RepID=A0A1S6QJJ5_9LACO|nr:hypothetical protein [Lentilactobacillus curieae]AQW21759.1 hypothetical protein PL11_007455 [Lentilactobacillus curieae]